MSERLSTEPTAVPDSGVTRSVLGPEYMICSWGEVVVAAVRSDTVTLFDGSPEPEIHHCQTSAAAHDAALQHAWSFEAARRALREAGQ